MLGEELPGAGGERFGPPGVLVELLREHEIDFLKWDMNRAFTEAGWPASDDPGRLWYDHVAGVYAVIDRLRADHPRLRIETCAGGRGWVELGMLARTDQAWTSDNTDPVDRTTAVQHVSEDRGEAVVLGWQPLARHGQPGPAPRLAGLDPDARYRQVGTESIHYGAVLLHHGPVLDLPAGDHASTLVHLRRVG